MLAPKLTNVTCSSEGSYLQRRNGDISGVLNVDKRTSKCLKSFVGVVSQEGLVILVLLTGPDQLGLVCRSEGHRRLTLAMLLSDANGTKRSDTWRNT